MKKPLKPGDLFNAHKAMAMKKKALKLNPPSKGHKPVGAHGKAAVKALGRTKTTGNFAKIEAAKGKGAAIAAYQNALSAHKAGKAKRTKKKINFGAIGQTIKNDAQAVGRGIKSGAQVIGGMGKAFGRSLVGADVRAITGKQKKKGKQKTNGAC